MQILLASAKIMNAATSVDIPMKSKPKFQEQAGLFALELSDIRVSGTRKSCCLPSLPTMARHINISRQTTLAKMILLLHKIISSSPLSYMVCCVLWI